MGSTDPLPALPELSSSARLSLGRLDEVHTVPEGVSKVAIKLWGGGGGGSFAESIRSHGGAGGLTVGTIPVVPGDVIRIRIRLGTNTSEAR